jgi:hypothetical protein
VVRGVYTFTKTADADSAFTLTGAALKNAITFDYETKTSYLATIRADNGAGSVITTTFGIAVLNVVEDTVPDAFTFTDVTNAALSTVYTSNTITVSGIDGPSPLSITGGEYQINGGAWASSATSANAGDTISVRGTSSSSNSTSVNVVLTIGGVSDTFTITTLAGAGGGGTDYTATFLLLDNTDYG